ncbi:MAG: hypothetical protein GY710_20155 [Desulfobacteraceae bacterium]|nr:hypothetical protein [Desulfobacteraceae bacterium]
MSFYDNVYKVIRQAKKPIIPATEAQITTQIIEAAMESQNWGKTIEFLIFLGSTKL